jgi:hypothetical protein
MTLLTHLLLVASLAALSLAACTDDHDCIDPQCEVNPQSDDKSDRPDGSELDRVRIEIEVVGNGTVVVEADEMVRCTGDQGLCSFSYVRGTPLVIYAASASDKAPTWQDACVGQSTCAIILDSDEVVVASFDDSITGQAGEYDGPDIIVDPFPGWYKSNAQQDAVLPTSATQD